MKCSVDELLTFFTQFYIKSGLSDVDAATMAGAIVHAESRGVSSHGLARARMYYERLLRGQLNAKTELTIESEGPATLAIDGNNA
ncbi:MAG: Ldh family oxidoreductase, partial [Sphaerochaeta sp.]